MKNDYRIYAWIAAGGAVGAALAALLPGIDIGVGIGAGVAAGLAGSSERKGGWICRRSRRNRKNTAEPRAEG